MKTARAALMESPAWALVGGAEAELGYDSNLYARNGGDGDGFAQVAPTLRFFRRASLTKFEVTAGLKAVKYFKFEDEDAIDPSLTLTYVYPETEETLSSQEVRASAAQSSSANADVGRRLVQREGLISWEGNIAATGKSVFQGRAQFRHTDFQEDSYNTNDSFDAGLTYELVAHDRLRYGLGYDLELNQSSPKSGSQDTTSVAHSLTVRGRGDFLPKIGGRFYLGIVSIDYSGAEERSDQDVIAGAELVWDATERLTMTSTVSRRIYFSPGGEAITRSTVSIGAEQMLTGGFSVTGEVEGSLADHEQAGNSRQDNSVSLRTGIRYAFTDRFSAAVSGGWTTQNSDFSTFDYNRALVSGNLSCRF